VGQPVGEQVGPGGGQQRPGDAGGDSAEDGGQGGVGHRGGDGEGEQNQGGAGGVRGEDGDDAGRVSAVTAWVTTASRMASVHDADARA
jgi:hypothetical protein